MIRSRLLVQALLLLSVFVISSADTSANGEASISMDMDISGTELSKVGDPVVWLFVVTNTSSYDAPDLALDSFTDTVLGDLTAAAFAAGCGELASGASCVFEVTRTVQPTDPDPLVNVAEVVYSAAGSGLAAGANDSHTVELFQPGVIIDKGGDTLSVVGHLAVNTFFVTNVSSYDAPDLALDSFTDTVLGDLTAAAFAAGCGALASGVSCAFEAARVVQPTDPDPLFSLATVHYHPAGFPNDITASDDHSLNLFQPALVLTMNGTTLSKVDDPVVYEFTVSNTSSDDSPPLDLISFVDDRLGDLTPYAYAAGCDVLPPGASCAFVVDSIVQPGDPDPLVSFATAVYRAAGFATEYAASAGHAVELFTPSLAVEKTGDALGLVGEPVTYGFQVTNTSTVDSPDLALDSFTDTVLGDLTAAAFAAGCGALASGVSCAFEAARVVQPTDPDPLFSLATVHYHPAGFPNDITASDDHSLNLFQPAIGVEVVGDLYSKHGDLAHWTVTAVNTSSADSPNLTCVLSDPVIELPETHFSFGPGETFVVDVVREISEPPDVNPLVDEAFLYCTVDGFHNELEARAGHSVELVHPDFEVALACSNEPVPQEGPAEYTATISNTGDVPLEVHTFPGDWFPLGTGDSMTYPVSVDGPFVSVPLVEGEVTATAVLPTEYGLDNVLTRTATASCAVASQVSVLKTTNGVEDPSRSWVFGIWEGPDGFDGYFLAIDTTLADPDGILAFGNLGLDAAGTYTLCEDSVPAGWATFWRVDADGDGLADTTVIPDNPNADDNPPQDLGNRCIDFGGGTGIDLLTAGGTLVFEVDNAFPGGAPRSPGYWKNWNRCTNGGQADGADANGGWVEGYWLLEDVLDPNIGGGIVWDDILSDDLEFPITTCEAAVAILDARDATGGKKKANDGAYTLARALLAAQLNFGAGACTTAEVLNTALAAETLLDELDFDGTGTYLRPKSADYGSALDLASELDAYNNGLICGDTE